MGDEPNRESTTAFEGAFGESLVRARQESAAFMNTVRFSLAAAFMVLYAITIYVFEDPFFESSKWLIGGYSLVAVVLWFSARRSPKILNASRFAVPLFDIPMTTVIQWFHIGQSEADEGVTMYALTVFVFLTVMSSFSIRSSHLIACAFIGTVCIWFLEWQSGMPKSSYFSAPLMIFATAFGMVYLAKKQTRLIRDAAERKTRRDRLARHFSPGVAEFIESRDDPGKGELCELTVLFCDIRGFTKLSESIETQEVINLLNEFHGCMVNAIFRFGGTLDKYLGDGLLAYFNAPARQKDHAERAVRCALAMIDDLEKLNENRLKNGDEPIKVGIGLHSGQAIVGEIGATHRREFTAIGDTVNVGSRIEGLTKEFESDLLISQQVVELVQSSSDEILFECVGDVPIRGRTQSIQIFVPSIRKSRLDPV